MGEDIHTYLLLLGIPSKPFADGEVGRREVLDVTVVHYSSPTGSKYLRIRSIEMYVFMAEYEYSGDARARGLWTSGLA